MRLLRVTLLLAAVACRRSPLDTDVVDTDTDVVDTDTDPVDTDTDPVDTDTDTDPVDTDTDTDPVDTVVPGDFAATSSGGGTANGDGRSLTVTVGVPSGRAQGGGYRLSLGPIVPVYPE